ncbi:WEB family protein At4g27595, chloroplastic-like isoform X1 [Gambusia affinis]|uniref:WEB family protein At4g27595, chloroplastic-like isoform X1 n=1 Tax=Gambusia affinis TaxID=33528 RepID=UPI001CDB8306|nr:WEB family protein At4g27595, chloroplastic-like isoform X1 [Gambusia affinis]
MFNFGKNPESSSKQEEDKEAVFGRAFSLLKEATDLFEKKEDLIDQLRQLQKKIADMKCINDDYLYLKSQIYIYGKVNEHLKREFYVLKEKLEAQATLRDKCRTKQNELDSIIESNEAFDTVVKELTLKLKNTKELKEEYRAVQDKKQTLKQENMCLEIQIYEIQRQLSVQSQLEKDCAEAEEYNNSLEMTNMIMERHLAGLEDTLWEKETNFMTSYTEKLQSKIIQLQKEFKAEQYWSDKLRHIRNHWSEIKQKNIKLQAEHEKLKRQLWKTRRFKNRNSEINSLIQEKEEENASLCLENERLRKKLQYIENTEDKLEESSDDVPGELVYPTMIEELKSAHAVFPPPVLPEEEAETSTSQGGQVTDSKLRQYLPLSETQPHSLREDPGFVVSTNVDASSAIHRVDDAVITVDHEWPSTHESEAQLSEQKEFWGNLLLYNMFFVVPETMYNHFFGGRQEHSPLTP